LKCPKCETVNSPDSQYCKKCAAPLPLFREIIFSKTETIITPGEKLSAGVTFAGRYRIIEKLGKGGMGLVYKAEDLKLKRTVALKFLLPDLGIDPGGRERLIREAQTASALNHPNICTIYEAGEENGDSYIVMEYIEGRSLHLMIPSRGLPVNDVMRYAIQIVDGLQHAHARGVIHRDLKPANVAITSEGRAKILDFGLAKRLRDEDLQDLTRSQLSLTDKGVIAGTLPYLAPEVLQGHPADARGDIWALGIILYVMVSGKLPFEGQTGYELTTAILRDAPAALPARISLGLRTVIHKCLEKDLEKRYQTAQDVGSVLQAAMPEKGLGPAKGAMKAWSKRGRWMWAGVALCLAAALFITRVPRSRTKTGAEKSRGTVSTGATASANSEANEYFERGMLFLKAQFNLPQARKMLDQALEFDPKFAEARAWFGFTYILEIDSGYSNDIGRLYRAEQELLRALQDDPNSARAHSSLAALYFYQGRKELVVEKAQKALEINPGEVDAKIWLSNYHESNGDFSMAKELLNQILKSDPLFFPARMCLGEILRSEGDVAGAIREQKKILEQDSRNTYASQKLARAFLDANDLVQARLTLENLSPDDQQGYEIRLTWALLLAVEGRKQEALAKMDGETLKYGSLAFWSTALVADIYAVMGEPQKALDWLELAVRNGDERDAWFNRDPLLINIRGILRFHQILESIKNRRKERHDLKEKR
jgi:tetratricopeptide (TPR) repeat protein